MSSSLKAPVGTHSLRTRLSAGNFQERAILSLRRPGSSPSGLVPPQSVADSDSAVTGQRPRQARRRNHPNAGLRSQESRAVGAATSRTRRWRQARCDIRSPSGRIAEKESSRSVVIGSCCVHCFVQCCRPELEDCSRCRIIQQGWSGGAQREGFRVGERDQQPRQSGNSRATPRGADSVAGGSRDADSVTDALRRTQDRKYREIKGESGFGPSRR